MPDPSFDSNILIDWLRDRPGARAELGVIRVIGSAASSGPIYSRASRPKAELLEPFDVVEVDAGIARMAADIRHSTRMNLLDALVLATARSNGAVLVTRNTRDFPAELPGIRVPYIL